jgi:hypothetical protein
MQHPGSACLLSLCVYYDFYLSLPCHSENAWNANLVKAVTYERKMFTTLAPGLEIQFQQKLDHTFQDNLIG